MTEVFVSYKREDEVRVARIVKGLGRAGVSVWWDRHLEGGARWRAVIEEKLAGARCVVVIWSRESVGPHGEFVQEEARRGKDRGVLVPVRIDRVEPPLGFGGVQWIDLAGWRGNPRNPHFRALVETVRAVVRGGPRPPAVAPARRARWLALVGSMIAAAAMGIGFAADVVGLQKIVCRAPGVHAVCAAYGLGGVPTEAEAKLWKARAAGDCAALQTYLARYPTGAYAEEARSRLAAATTRVEEDWRPERLILPLALRLSAEPLPTESAARKDALRRAEGEAMELCGMYPSRDFRVKEISADVRSWRCIPRSGGWVCGFDGEVICRVEARHAAERKECS